MCQLYLLVFFGKCLLSVVDGCHQENRPFSLYLSQNLEDIKYPQYLT